MSEQGNREPGIAGDTDHEQHRAGPGEGVRAPFATETGVAEISVFDGAGNESVVRHMADEDGRQAQGTGESSAEAEEDAKGLLDKARQSLGDAFSPGTGH